MYTLVIVLGVLVLVCASIIVLGLAVILGMELLSWVALTLAAIWEACSSEHDKL